MPVRVGADTSPAARRAAGARASGRPASWVRHLARWRSVIVLSALLGVGCTDSAVGARQARTPDVPYEPSPAAVVEAMLELAQVTPRDVVYDLGCGDGRIVIAAVEQRGARGVCIDIDPQRIRESRANARRAGVEERITFVVGDMFEARLSDASVVMLFLWPEVNLRLRPKLARELRPGARIVSHYHDMGDWQPNRLVHVHAAGRSRPVYLWVMGPSGAPVTPTSAQSSAH